MVLAASKLSESGSRKPSSPLRRVVYWLTFALGVASCVAVFGATALIYGPGERWWPTTLVLFGPTWLLQLPLGAALLAWLLFHRGLLLGGFLVVSQLLLQLVVLGFCLPGRGGDPSSSLPSIRIATWNLGGRSLSHESATRMMAQNRVDVLVLQECGSLPTQTELPGLHQHENLGMCLLSRFPVTEVADRDRKDVWEAAGSGAIVRYTLDAGWGAFTLTNVHLETPREGFEAFFDADVGSGIAALAAKNAQRYAEAQLAFEWTHRGAPLPRLVAGDFNTPAQSDLLRETWSDYDNCFGVTGYGYGHTKETRLLGVRIDNILASQEWSCVATEVLDGFQSDHRPVVAEVQLKAD